MSRVADLYWEAAACATPPASRIYFDTEALKNGNWPVFSNQFAFCLRLCSTMKMELYVPEPVLHERAEQWIRERVEELTALTDKAAATQTEIQALFDLVDENARNAIGPAVILRLPHPQQLRTCYTDVEKKALQTFNFNICPYGAMPLSEAFRLAVARDFTFEEKKPGVVGLQDCVILISVIEHLRANPTTAAFISHDAVFSRLSTLSGRWNVDLRHISGIDSLEQELDKAHEVAYNEVFGMWWGNESDRILESLNDNRSRIEEFLAVTIEPSEIEQRVAGTVISIGPPKIVDIRIVRPELKGESNEPIRFSSDLIVTYRLTIDRLAVGFGLSDALAAYQPPEGQSPTPPPRMERIEDIASRRTVELSAELTPEYTELRLLSAKIRQ